MRCEKSIQSMIKRGAKIETLYHFVIQSVAKDLVNTHFVYPRFFASL